MLTRLLILLVMVLPLASAAEEPSKQSLIDAWAEQQKARSDMQRFERISDTVFEVKSDVLRFDGKVQIIDTFIESFGNDSFMGSVQIEPLDVHKDFYEHATMSFHRWLSPDYLYYVPSQGGWVDEVKWSAANRAKRKECEQKKFYSKWLAALIPLAFLILFFLLLMRSPAARRQRELVQRSFDHMEKAERLLEEIRDQLQKRNET